MREREISIGYLGCASLDLLAAAAAMVASKKRDLPLSRGRGGDRAAPCLNTRQTNRARYQEPCPGSNQANTQRNLSVADDEEESGMSAASFEGGSVEAETRAEIN